MAKNKINAVISNIAWMIFDKVFMLVLNLLVTVQVANYFGVSEYGNYQYAVSVVAILEIFVTFVDGRVVKKHYQESDPGTVAFNASICRAIFSIGAAAIGVILVQIENRGTQYAWMFSVLLINMIITNLRFGMANRFEYMLKSKKIVIAADASMLLSSLLQLVAVRQNASIVSISMIAAFASTVNLIIIFIQYKREFASEGRKRFDKRLVGNMIRESLPLAVAASCATIYSRCDSIMLGNLCSSAEVGIYSIAVRLISVVQIAIAPIRESVYPRMIHLYAEDKEAYARRYIQITSLMTWICIVGVLFSFVVLPHAFRFLDPEYAEAYPVYRIYVLGTLFMYNASLRAGHFTMINKGSVLMYSQIISLVLNVVLNYIGIQAIGLYGAAIATVITQMISLLVSNAFFGKHGREVLVWQLKGFNPIYIFKK